MFRITDEQIGSRVLLNISGSNTGIESYRQISERINYLIGKNVANLVFDLSRMESVDSGMVNLIVSTNNKLRELGGNVELIYQSKAGKDMFGISGLYKVLLAHYKTRKDFDERKQHYCVRGPS